MTERIIERVIGSMRDDLAARLAEGNPPEAGLSVMMLEPAQGPAGGVVLVHARNVVVAPALGLVLDGRSYTPLFAPAAQVPDAAIARTQARAARAGTLPRIARAALLCGAGAGGEEVVYLSRRGFTGRIVVNERALERALAARGVRVLRPERLSVAAQARAMARARLVIGASGAGLANMVFMAPGARLLELRPDPVREPWMALASAARGIGHDVLALEGPLPRAEIPAVQRLRQWPRRLTGRYHYALKADIDAVLARIG